MANLSSSLTAANHLLGLTDPPPLTHLRCRCCWSHPPPPPRSTSHHSLPVTSCIPHSLTYHTNLTVNDVHIHNFFCTSSLHHHSHSQLHFGTKTAYTAPPSPLLIPYDWFGGVELVHVSLVARHGTRNPTMNCVKRMNKLAAWLKQSISAKTGTTHVPAWLMHFANTISTYRGRPGELTEHGESELCGIGDRFAAVYGNRFEGGNRGISVRARSSYKNRAVQSGNSFLQAFLAYCEGHKLPVRYRGMLQDLDEDTDPEADDESPNGTDTESEKEPQTSASASNVQVSSTGHDEVLRFYERHTEYASFSGVHKRLTRHDLAHGPLSTHAKRVASRVSNELNADSPLPISLLRPLWEACAFEHAHGRSGKLANVLKSRDTILLEMFERHHRPCFKAHQRFKSAAAPLVKDLADSLRNARNGTGVHVDLRFAHAETLVPLFLLLQVLDFKELDGNEPDYRGGLSALAPFAANLAIELYQQKKASGEKRFFVRFRLHERYINEIPALGNEGSGEIELDALLAFFDTVLDDGMKYYQSVDS